MNEYPPEMARLVEEATAAFKADDAGRVRAILQRAPALKAVLNQPIGPFDSPPIANVRSRAMLDVLLDAGADINARSRWWAGGFGLLDCASLELAAYAIERGAALDAHAAARLGMLEALRDLVSKHAAVVHARGGDGRDAPALRAHRRCRGLPARSGCRHRRQGRRPRVHSGAIHG